MSRQCDVNKQAGIDLIKSIHAKGYVFTLGALEAEKEHIKDVCLWDADNEYCKIAPWLVLFDIDPDEVQIPSDSPEFHTLAPSGTTLTHTAPLSFCYPEYRKVNLDEDPDYEGNKTGEWLVCGQTPLAPYGADDYSWFRAKCETWDTMIAIGENDEVQ